MPDASLLVVEDDPAIAGMVVRGLRAAGFAVELAADGEVGLARALSGEFDLVVLDLMLPGRSGYDILEACRARVGLPILVLSARTDLDARLRTFELGALDYLPKPFFLEELVARVRARLRRPAEGPRRVVRFADAEVDVDARRVSVGGAPVDLTTHELSLLLYLLERPGRAVTREQLREGALPYDSEALDRTVDSHVSRVRKKLGDAAGGRVETVWRIGYRFVPDAGG